MKRKKRFISFYKINTGYYIPYIQKYGLVCTRSLWQCYKLGFKHIREGKAIFFIIRKIKPKV